MSNDTLLQKAVIDELSWEPSVTSAHIGVAANKGVVTLTGHVGSYAEKHAAESAAGRVKGVRAVAEEIEVKLSNDMMRTDDQIAEAILKNLDWDVSVPSDKIKVKVDKGLVTLTGAVNWHFQKDAAEQDCRRMSGVFGVINEIAIKPHVHAFEVEEKIRTALHRSWYEPMDVTVRAEGGKVLLGGSVHTWHERQMAESAAWGAPGVTQVQDNIAVTL